MKLISGYFSDEFLESLPSDVDLRDMMVCEEAIRFINHCGNDSQYYRDKVAVWSILLAYSEGREVHAELQGLNIENLSGNSLLVAINKIYEPAKRNTWKKEMHSVFSEARLSFGSKLGKYYGYSFSDDEYGEIRNCLDELKALLEEDSVIDVRLKSKVRTAVKRMIAEITQNNADISQFYQFAGAAHLVIDKHMGFVDTFAALSERLTRGIMNPVRTQEQIAPLKGLGPGDVKRIINGRTNH